MRSWAGWQGADCSLPTGFISLKRENWGFHRVPRGNLEEVGNEEVHPLAPVLTSHWHSLLGGESTGYFCAEGCDVWSAAGEGTLRILHRFYLFLLTPLRLDCL